MDSSATPYLIIAGTTKAATTSLFFYLAAHPQVCAASMKETRFFLDANYPIRRKYKFEDGLDKYEEFFSHCSDQSLRLEATPDYLYSPGTAFRIKESLPSVKLVFVLREPISRLISWYKFARYNQLISDHIDFANYVEKQLESDGTNGEEQPMRALEQGRYSVYLQPYFEAFGQERIYIAFFENLCNNSRNVLESLSYFAGIDPIFYSDYDFTIFNRTVLVKSPQLHRIYTRFRFYIRKYTHNKPLIHNTLKRIRLAVDSLYFYLNKSASPEGFDIPSNLSAILEDYYQQEAKKLTELTGRPIPW